MPATSNDATSHNLVVKLKKAAMSPLVADSIAIPEDPIQDGIEVEVTVADLSQELPYVITIAGSQVTITLANGALDIITDDAVDLELNGTAGLSQLTVASAGRVSFNDPINVIHVNLDTAKVYVNHDFQAQNLCLNTHLFNVGAQDKQVNFIVEKIDLNAHFIIQEGNSQFTVNSAPTNRFEVHQLFFQKHGCSLLLDDCIVAFAEGTDCGFYGTTSFNNCVITANNLRAYNLNLCGTNLKVTDLGLLGNGNVRIEHSKLEIAGNLTHNATEVTYENSTVDTKNYNGNSKVRFIATQLQAEFYSQSEAAEYDNSTITATNLTHVNGHHKANASKFISPAFTSTDALSLFEFDNCELIVGGLCTTGKLQANGTVFEIENCLNLKEAQYNECKITADRYFQGMKLDASQTNIITSQLSVIGGCQTKFDNCNVNTISTAHMSGDVTFIEGEFNAKEVLVAAPMIANGTKFATEKVTISNALTLDHVNWENAFDFAISRNTKMKVKGGTFKSKSLDCGGYLKFSDECNVQIESTNVRGMLWLKKIPAALGELTIGYSANLIALASDFKAKLIQLEGGLLLVDGKPEIQQDFNIQLSSKVKLNNSRVKARNIINDGSVQGDNSEMIAAGYYLRRFGIDPNDTINVRIIENTPQRRYGSNGTLSFFRQVLHFIFLPVTLIVKFLKAIFNAVYSLVSHNQIANNAVTHHNTISINTATELKRRDFAPLGSLATNTTQAHDLLWTYVNSKPRLQSTIEPTANDVNANSVGLRIG